MRLRVQPAVRSLVRRAQLVRRAHTLGVMNVGLQRAPLDHPIMAEFVEATPQVNALARSSPGFVWSFDNDDFSARADVPELVADPLLMPQLSVWTDVRSLKHFAFRSDHVSYYKRRREWFEDIEPPFSVLWWRQASLTRGLEPSLAEAFDRLRHLKANGPSEFAFTIKTAAAYPKPEGACPPLPSYDAVAAEAGRSQAM
jgi:hypothetical protein